MVVGRGLATIGQVWPSTNLLLLPLLKLDQLDLIRK